MSSLTVTPSTPLSPPGDAASTPSKQLHPSESQMSAELALGIDPASASAVGSISNSSPTQTLLAPKPTVIETRSGPVSPKVSPRMLSRTLERRAGDAAPNGPAGGVTGGRSPAYSANSSPRGPSSHRALNGSGSASSLGATATGKGDEGESAPVDRRGSGGLSNLLNLNSNGQASGGAASSIGGLVMPSAGLVRRASKPMILASGTNATLQALLSKYTVADILTRRDVIEIQSTATPAEGFEMLLKNNVLSAPVWDVSKHEYIGFLDVRDLVSSIVFAHEEQKLTGPHEAAPRLGQSSSILQKFGSSVSVAYLSRRNPFKPIAKTATLLQVAKALSTQLHRLPVVDAQGKCVSIISQSSIVQFLHLHRDEVKGELAQTIGQLQVGMCKVISVNSDASAWQAFKTLEVNGVSGIAIVDRDGKLVANTSARDLKWVLHNKGTISLDEPIQKYLSQIRNAVAGDESHPSCSIGLTTTVAHAIGLLAATGYHRVFIVDANSRPVGVVSVADILRFCSAEPASGLTLAAASSSPSNPTTPRGSFAKRATSDSVSPLPAGSLSATASPVSPSPKVGMKTTASQSTTPVVTPNV